MANIPFSSSSVSLFGGAASDLFAAQGDKAKAQFDFAEGKNCLPVITHSKTVIKLAQEELPYIT